MVERFSTYAPLLAGPLALVAFFLPWTHGTGALRYESYSGFELVGLTTVLQQLDLPTTSGFALHATRGLLLLIPVAAVWMMLLAPAHRWHWGYRAATAYLVFAGFALAAVGLARSGLGLPSPGIALLLVASLAALAPYIGLGLDRSRGVTGAVKSPGWR